MNEPFDIEALRYCLEHEAHEDVLFHLAACFFETLPKVNKDLIKQGDQKIFTPEGALSYYFFGEKKRKVK